MHLSALVQFSLSTDCFIRELAIDLFSQNKAP